MQPTDTLHFVATRDTAICPTRATEYSAGFDLAAAAPIMMLSGRVHLVPTGVSVQLPAGHYGRIALRSGWSTRNHAVCTAGVIDRDYKGEIFVAVATLGDTIVTLPVGTKFAQLIIEPYYSTPHECMFSAAFTGHPGDASQHAGFGSTDAPR